MKPTTSSAPWLKGTEDGYEVAVVSGDKDLTQLASDHVTVYVTKSGVTKLEAFTPDHMKEVNGVTPTEFIDMKALMGDPSDNYPGVAKVGPKTASKLIQEYGSVENLYDHVDEMKKSKLKENLIAGKDNALLGKKLATINCDSPVEVTLDDLSYEGSNIMTSVALFKDELPPLSPTWPKKELTENKTEVTGLCRAQLIT